MASASVAPATSGTVTSPRRGRHGRGHDRAAPGPAIVPAPEPGSMTVPSARAADWTNVGVAEDRARRPRVAVRARSYGSPMMFGVETSPLLPDPGSRSLPASTAPARTPTSAVAQEHDPDRPATWRSRSGRAVAGAGLRRAASSGEPPAISTISVDARVDRMARTTRRRSSRQVPTHGSAAGDQLPEPVGPQQVAERSGRSRRGRARCPDRRGPGGGLARPSAAVRSRSTMPRRVDHHDARVGLARRAGVRMRALKAVGRREEQAGRRSAR